MNKAQITAAARTATLVNYNDNRVPVAARVLDADTLWTARSSWGNGYRFTRSSRTTARRDNFESTGYLVLVVSRPITRVMDPADKAAAELFLATTTLTAAELLDDKRQVDWSKLPANIGVRIVNPRELSAR